MDFIEFQNEMAQILQTSASEISGDTTLADLKAWDSMSVLLYMALAEEKFGHTVAPEAISAAQTIQDLYHLATKPN